MRATLVFNEKSGGATSPELLVDELSCVGWKVGRVVSKEQLDDCLCHGTDVVIVAGGDGTISRVAKRLAGTHIPMGIVPMGTANNIARSLGLGVDPTVAIQGLAHPQERNLDLGVIKSATSTFYFLEGFGIGVFADVIAEKASKKTKQLRRALDLLANELETYTPLPFELEVEGRNRSGNYLLAAVMNTRSIGPALELAPDAKCDDGELDVVLVHPEARKALVTHLKRAAEEADIVLPTFETVRATHVRMRADERWVHIDDRAHELPGGLTIDVAVGAVRMLSPSPAPHGARGPERGSVGKK
jgi:diacylglycerol kinase (ATP)